MNSRRMKELTERQFQRVLIREGKTVLKSLTHEEVTVLFRETKGSSGDHVTIYYEQSANLQKGDIIEYKGHRYLLSNVNSIQSEVYKVSVLKRCTVYLNVYGKKVPMAMVADMYSSNFGASLINSLGLVTKDTATIKEVRKNDKYICFGGIYVVKSLFYNDGVAYILLERTGDALYSLKEIKYYGSTTFNLEEKTVQMPFAVLTTVDDIVWSEAEITYKSSNPNIAEIDSGGWLTLKQRGVITITAVCEDIIVKKTITIK